MRALVLVDGEHYPPVTRDAVAAVRASGHDVVGAVFLGGREKLKGEPIFTDLEMVVGDGLVSALREGLSTFRPDVVFDLSDAPVLDAPSRLMLASVTLAAGVAYEGRGFRFDAPSWPRQSPRYTISVIGSGKRTGKTAVCAALARHLSSHGSTPLIVAMGRGGPSAPVVTRGADAPPSIDALIALADAGEHASTDAYEDAIIARCTTVGARRGGAGLSGDPFIHTVDAAIAVADAEPHDVLLLEGSGTAIPPAAADRTLFVVGGTTSPDALFSGLGDLRLELADAIVVTGVDAPGCDAVALIDAISRRRRELGREPIPIVATTFRMQPLEPIDGAAVAIATTAPSWAGDSLRRRVAELGAHAVAVTHMLSDRDALRADLAGMGNDPEVLITEIKAAGIDVAAGFARDRGWRVVLCDNVPTPVGDPADLEHLFDALRPT